MTINAPRSALTSRQQLRKALRERRRALSDTAQQHAATAVCQQLFTMFTSQTRRVAGYLANDGEIMLGPTLAACHQQTIAVSLPLLHPFTGKHLLFQNYTPTTPMTANRFGIHEPELNSTQIRLLHEHDMLLMPLVGFDARGNRLGMGGGFYDRTLAHVYRLKRRPLLVGIAHDCQQVDTLPVQSWDIPLDCIVTPGQIITLSLNI
ncbi:5-formyltetrahydrofolate cyclo-ligase [Alteromonas gilva]|uniref:5-formyltetrahydrofolate cyclo-ligase n=1 Tax=Alteromonas gilva TaxID=2987522 RepID=A0ABT5L000_9ALTE|nr:5-formyltetrahydrofolate cyclo-ligase [Alteromonas gilva]MDC8830203.1 5-formyltetrahydrofolate cyclo-ligase [Alteromonas gilva]